MPEENPHYWARRAFDRQDEWYTKQNEVTIESGNLAVRSTTIMNGGACLALLAFLANTYTAENLSPQQRQLLEAIILSLQYFAWGLFCAVLASGTAYLVNRSFLAGNYYREKRHDHPFIFDTPVSARWMLGGNVLTFLAIGFVIGSLILFMLGLLSISNALPL